MITASQINTRVYNGFEASMQARLPRGGFLLGSVTPQRTATNTCDVNDPNTRRFCDLTPVFRTMSKLSGSYPLPCDLLVSGILTMWPGASMGASYSVNSSIAGVPLTGGARSASKRVGDRSTVATQSLV